MNSAFSQAYCLHMYGSYFPVYLLFSLRRRFGPSSVKSNIIFLTDDMSYNFMLSSRFVKFDIDI